MRFIGDAEARIKEDYLRILRFFRFNAHYGNGPFDPEGLRACVKLRGGIARLSAERVAGEVRRLLVAPQAFRAVEAMFDYGLLTHVLGGVPRLERFRRLVEIEGALGMALSGPDTGGSQFFITHSPQPHLDGGYTVFGRVTPATLPAVFGVAQDDVIQSIQIVR